MEEDEIIDTTDEPEEQPVEETKPQDQKKYSEPVAIPARPIQAKKAPMLSPKPNTLRNKPEAKAAPVIPVKQSKADSIGDTKDADEISFLAPPMPAKLKAASEAKAAEPKKGINYY